MIFLDAWQSGGKLFAVNVRGSMAMTATVPFYRLWWRRGLHGEVVVQAGKSKAQPLARVVKDNACGSA